MPTNLNLDDEVNAVENTSDSATGFANRLIALVKAGFKSDANPFGDAATRDSWDGQGDAPTGVNGQLARLNSSGKIPGAMLDVAATPGASKTQAGVLRKWDGTGSLPSDLDDGNVAPVLNTSGKTPDALLPDSALRVGGPPDGVFERRITGTVRNRRTTYSPTEVLLQQSDIASGGTVIPMTHKLYDPQSQFSVSSSGYVNLPVGSYFVMGYALYGSLSLALMSIEHSDADDSNRVRSNPVVLQSNYNGNQAIFSFSRASAGRLRLKVMSAAGGGTRIGVAFLNSLEDYTGDTTITHISAWIRIWKTA